MLLVGFSELTIDPKQRLAIPAKYRSAWMAERDGTGWVSVPWPDGSIRLYTETRFRELASHGRQSLTPDPDSAAHQRALFGFAEVLEMDSAGRVTLPRHQLQKTKLSGEVVVVGALDRLEIWPREKWKADEPQLFASMPERAARAEMNALGLNQSSGPAGRT